MHDIISCILIGLLTLKLCLPDKDGPSFSTEPSSAILSPYPTWNKIKIIRKTLISEVEKVLTLTCDKRPSNLILFSDTEIKSKKARL